jgi:hypothetical protein
LEGDFDHDGLADVAFGGTEGGRYVLAIVRGPFQENSEWWLFKFRIVSPSRRITELCSIKATISTRSPVLLGSEKGSWKIPSASKGIVVDDGCDPVNVSWDQDRKNFELLRIYISL